MSKTLLHVAGVVLLWAFITFVGAFCTWHMGNDDVYEPDSRTTWREAFACALVVEGIFGFVGGLIYAIGRLLTA